MSKKFKVTYKFVNDKSTNSVTFNSIYELYGGLSVLFGDYIATHDVIDIEIL